MERGTSGSTLCEALELVEWEDWTEEWEDECDELPSSSSPIGSSPCCSILTRRSSFFLWPTWTPVPTVRYIHQIYIYIWFRDMNAFNVT